MAMALHFKGHLNWFLRTPRRVETVANRLLRLSEQHGLSYASDLARVLLGSARSELGHAAEGIELINRALIGFEKTGAKVAITYFLTLLSQAHARAGDFESAIRSVEDALAANPQELIWRPYTLTWRGELRRKRGQAAMAEADFHEAIEVSRSLGHKVWELRAATCLARLLVSNGKYLSAQESLAPVSLSFGENFRTRRTTRGQIAPGGARASRTSGAIAPWYDRPACTELPGWRHADAPPTWPRPPVGRAVPPPPAPPP